MLEITLLAIIRFDDLNCLIIAYYIVNKKRK